MSRGTIYSSDQNLPRRNREGDHPAPQGAPASAGAEDRREGNAPRQEEPSKLRRPERGAGALSLLRRKAGYVVGAAALLLLGAFLLFDPGDPGVSREEFETAVREALAQMPPERSIAAVAHEVIAPSVVRVSRLGQSDDSDILGVGTGVVIDQAGIILTSLHVVVGAPRIAIHFADGFETQGQIISQDPSNDLAVLEVDVVPEGVPAATVVSTDEVALGDQVVVVGHPFGIGPSVSSGVVSGLGRRYSSPDGSMVFDNLIQFDAAANPGNSGGPLVNRNGEVLGIVSSIYNPTEQRVFIGIGFAVPIETAAAAAGESPF